jgi:hypothetical protein
VSALAEQFRAATANGSVPQVRKATATFWRDNRGAADDVFAALRELWDATAGSRAADRPVRLGVVMTGGPVAAAGVAGAEEFLTGTVAADDDWRVQEALAKGFDWMCAERGFPASLPLIEAWLGHRTANVRRAAAEGPRVWTRRPYFDSNPEHAVRLLGGLRADPSDYVRRSVANAISDIGKTHPGAVRAALARWAGEPDAAWVVKHAGRHLR